MRATDEMRLQGLWKKDSELALDETCVTIIYLSIRLLEFVNLFLY